MLNLSADEIKKMWADGAGDRRKMTLRRNYYDGEATAAELLLNRMDRRTKTVIRSQWIKQIVDFHTSFLVGQPVSYSTAGDDKAALDAWIGLVRDSGLHLLDERNTADAILYGRSVELVGFNGQAPVFQHFDPSSWAMIYDGDRLAGAIYHLDVPASTYFEGEIQKEPRSIFWTYDDTTIARYEDLGVKGLVAVGKPKAHNLGAIPVIDYRFGRKPFVGPALINEVDVWAVLRGAMVDDVKYCVDALLMLKNVSMDKLLEEDDAGVTLFARLQALGILPLESEADASYLSRVVDTKKFEYAIGQVRQTIHEIGCMPDLDTKVQPTGTVGSQTLEMFFQAAIQRASSFKRYLEKGLRQRIDLVNAIWSRLNKPTLQSVDIRIEPNLPKNDLAMMQYMSGLDGVLAKKDQIKLFSFVTNPDQAYANLMAERAETPPE